MNVASDELMRLWPRVGVRPHVVHPTTFWSGAWSPTPLTPGRYRACIEAAVRVEVQAYDVAEGRPLATTYGGPGTIEIDFLVTAPMYVQVRTRLRSTLEPLTPGVRVAPPREVS